MGDCGFPDFVIERPGYVARVAGAARGHYWGLRSADCGLRIGEPGRPSPRPSPPGEGEAEDAISTKHGKGEAGAQRPSSKCESDQIQPNQTKSSQTNQIQPNQTKSSQIKPNPAKQTKSNQSGSTRIKAPAVGSKLGRINGDVGRARWVRGNAESMNRRAKWLGDRNTCFVCDAGERGSGIRGKCSLMFAYVRLCSLNLEKNVWGRCARSPGDAKAGMSTAVT